MPKYVRKSSVIRDNWTEEALKNAMYAVKNDNVSVYSAAITHGVPRSTLERKIKTNNDINGGMVPTCVSGVANEKRLAKHIKKM